MDLVFVGNPYDPRVRMWVQQALRSAPALHGGIVAPRRLTRQLALSWRDAAQCGRVFAGEFDLALIAAGWTPVPTWEAKRQLLNRIAELTLGVDSNMGPRKLYEAIGDALLIEEGIHHPSAAVRLERLRSQTWTVPREVAALTEVALASRSAPTEVRFDSDVARDHVRFVQERFLTDWEEAMAMTRPGFRRRRAYALARSVQDRDLWQAAAAVEPIALVWRAALRTARDATPIAPVWRQRYERCLQPIIEVQRLP